MGRADVQGKTDAVGSEQQPADYVVGQVSGSLFPAPPSGSGSLSALFSPAAPAPVVFVPAPKLVVKIPEVKKQTVPAGVKGQAAQRQKKAPVKPADCQHLVDRESALQNADKQEQQKKPPKPKRRKAAVALGDEEEEEAVVRPPKRPRNTPSAPQEGKKKEEEEEKKKRTVFVGNLPASFTKKGLLRLFREKGAVESTRFRSVVREDPSVSLRVATIQRKVHPMKQSLNAYVVFKDEDGASKALERNGLEVEKDYIIRVDRVTENSHDHKRSLFVGNLAFELKEASLREHFSACGPVDGVRLVRDKDSGLGKGFGYVLFESADSVQLALKLDGTMLEGRKVRVKRSVKEKEKKKATSTSSGVGAKRAAAGPGRGGRAGRPGGGAKEKQATGKAANAAAFRRRVEKKTQPAKPSSFRGEMADAGKTAKIKKKFKIKVQKKKKTKGKKKIHIE
ncbi:RNA-binding protein 34 [Merluccius polli]|uniref:RNA-binding protein 34 n=1 Tax=Merluccius polli TaxID=89951 RepID=A0AA47NRU7_MERPO|nr:RNA-binding protein 34 [Merluccius polli]